MESCKSLGKEILTASIDELKAFGIPDQNVQKEGMISLDVITAALENELKVSQYKELVSIIKSAESSDTKAQMIKDKVNSFGAGSAESILSVLLAHTGLKDAF